LEALEDVKVAQRALNDTRKPIQALREIIDEVLDEISTVILFVHRKETNVEKRQQLRLFGVEYSFDTAENEKDEDEIINGGKEGHNAKVDDGVEDDVDDDADDDEDIGIDEEGVN